MAVTASMVASMSWLGSMGERVLTPRARAAQRMARWAALLEGGGAERSAQRIASIDAMLEGGRRRVMQVGPSLYVVADGGLLCLERRKKTPLEPIEPRLLRREAIDGARISLGDGKAVEFSVVNCADYEIFDNNGGRLLKNAADYDKIDNSIFLRSRQAGDRIQPAGRGCTKLLKKLYSEMGAADRERLCVLADENGVFFAEGVGVDERVRVDKATTHIMLIAFAHDGADGRMAPEEETA